MKILVTGGAGFIGSAFIRKLLEIKKFEILNIDNLSYAGNLNNIPNKDNNYEFLELDIVNYDDLSKVINDFKPVKIFNFAAESHVDRSIKSSKNFLTTNIIGTYNILESIRSYPALIKDEQFIFHHISTDEVYGDIDINAQSPTENSPYNPSSPYSATKASSDMLVMAWNRTYKIPTIITNCTNNYGPYQYPEKLIPVIILNALHKKKIPLYGDGEQIRDWIHVNDHVDGLINLMENGISGNSYHFGGNNQINNFFVAQEICRIIENRIGDGFNYQSLIKYVDDRPGHDKRYALDINKSKRLLNWSPKISFEEGIENTVEWYLNNKDWWIELYK
jgi:dTDP-glucose 4,6-dehydratase